MQEDHKTHFEKYWSISSLITKPVKLYGLNRQYTYVNYTRKIKSSMQNRMLPDYNRSICFNRSLGQGCRFVFLFLLLFLNSKVEYVLVSLKGVAILKFYFRLKT